ncbi:DUF998 domain-containing protein [Agrococcus beijingensis]|uniref:DUF998 domain-containing protein n=1 Tax=Agrococcus beijingensis TaxID=3068634 RepID=UPI002742770E|nr:DUF998 domain-containing protein [Agrococcus sp. REN33]
MSSEPTAHARARPGDRARQELQAVVTAAIAGVLAFVLGLALMGDGLRPIGGDGSVARIAAFTTGAAAAASFVAARLTSDLPLSRLGERLERTVSIVGAAAIALVCFGLGYLAALSAGEIMQAGFVGLELDAFAGALACALAGATAAYVAHPLGHDISTRTLGTLVPAFLVVGVVFSMLTASDEQWWQLHFSQLGAGGGISGFAFNITLVLSGLLVSTMGAYVRGDLEAATVGSAARSARWVGRLLAAIGLCMVLTGLVRVDIAEWLHIGFASSMVVLFCVLCVGLPRFAPRLPKAIHVVSIAMVIGTVAALALWVPVGYYNFTGFEFAACGLIFVWLSAFIRAIDAATADREDAAAHPLPLADSTSVAAGGKVGT